MKLRKIIFYPFGIIYGCIAWLRRRYFDFFETKRKSFSVNTIAIGNITVGGTGKTPIAIWLADMLSNLSETAVLSRGYGRKTKGFLEVTTQSNPADTGDEPLEIKLALTSEQLHNYVCENRPAGIQKILQCQPQTRYVVLDDAFQHLPLKADFYLLLCDYNRPFYQDFPLPAGNLREFASAAHQADAILFTKCPENISLEEALLLQKKVSKYGKPVFFSVFNNALPTTAAGEAAANGQKMFVFSGLAQDANLIKWANTVVDVVGSRSFADHHMYSLEELEQLNVAAKKSGATGLLTTRKDWMRIQSRWPEHFLPVFITWTEPNFLFGGEEELFHLILKRFE